MKKFSTFIPALLFCFHSPAQSTFVSPDGRSIWDYNDRTGMSIYREGQAHYTVAGAGFVCFDPAGRSVLFRSKDSLCRHYFNNDRTILLALVSSYRLPNPPGSSWIAYLMKDGRGQL
ncbi:MAG TPA: hypothetical protein VHE54_14980, partial [Puia sp.]|nr:hypothetical protein [Puia sp.]